MANTYINKGIEIFGGVIVTGLIFNFVATNVFNLTGITLAVVTVVPALFVLGVLSKVV